MGGPLRTSALNHQHLVSSKTQMLFIEFHGYCHNITNNRMWMGANYYQYMSVTICFWIRYAPQPGSVGPTRVNKRVISLSSFSFIFCFMSISLLHPSQSASYTLSFTHTAMICFHYVSIMSYESLTMHTVYVNNNKVQLLKTHSNNTHFTVHFSQPNLIFHSHFQSIWPNIVIIIITSSDLQAKLSQELTLSQNPPYGRSLFHEFVMLLSNHVSVQVLYIPSSWGSAACFVQRTEEWQVSP